MWETLVNLVCRPPRYVYDPDVNLGPKKFRIMGKIFERKDIEVYNKRGQVLKCSHFLPLEQAHERQKKYPCVIYCHGNCGSRADAADCLDLLLPNGITVFAFDFSGSGLSEGETISLGYYEKDDLAEVVAYLRRTEKVSRIGLWGRSMGAATSILYAATDPSIAGMVLDSSFFSLTEVMHELANQYIRQVKLPKLLINGAISVLRKSVQKKANFDIRLVNPSGACPSCFIPALFAHADGDDFVLPTHSAQLYELYAGDKNMITFAGDHNSPRPAFFFDSVGIFFYNTLLDDTEQTAAYKYAKPENDGISDWADVASPPAAPQQPQIPTSSLHQQQQQQQQYPQQSSAAISKPAAEYVNSGPKVLHHPRTGVHVNSNNNPQDAAASSQQQHQQQQQHHSSPPVSRDSWGNVAVAAAAFSPLSNPHNPDEEEKEMVQALRSSLQQMKGEYGNGDENVAELEKILDEYIIVQQDSPQSVKRAQQQQQLLIQRQREQLQQYEQQQQQQPYHHQQQQQYQQQYTYQPGQMYEL